MFSSISFGQFFFHMGPYRWPMILLFLLVVILILKKVIDIYIVKESTNKQLKWGLNGILFWGSLAFALGLFGQVNALWLALQEIMVASDISPSIVLIGYYLSFVTTIFGLFTVIIAALGWWILRGLVKRKLN